ncbi:MAG: diguanylate cyclase [Proteobacteria bacterium]|nr:diguanylate cyclase [Pseudomonadota bacterium]MBU1688261.1 diguanylate cyclase [Pseudomonadota bacterium]
MDKILVVEDSRLFSSIIKKQIETETGFEVTVAETLAEAETILRGDTNYFMSLLDLNLPDAPRGEIVDLVLSHHVPVGVVTGDLSDDARERIWAKNVVDYVLKEGPHSVDYLVSLVQRIYRNRSIKVLVVDDSTFSRSIVSDLLKVHQYIVFEAADGQEAMAILTREKGIRMVVTDYNMPKMNGFELTRNIRNDFGRDEVSIIGISGQEGNILSAKFIKYGANDFIVKPFAHEEFYCRITQCIEMMENIDRVKKLSNTDPLTGLYNRRFFFDSGDKIHASAGRNQITISVAMFDIDFFKKINDTYGHDVGDEVIKSLAHLLLDRFRTTDIVSRFGGEEFCVLMVDMDPEKILSFLDALRLKIEALIIRVAGQTVRFTVSIGLCTTLHNTLEEMIKQSDLCLYQAKESGRNQLISDFTP